MVDKVIHATQLAQEKAPELILDGELQVDAALSPPVSEKKAPSNIVKGEANILIFPLISIQVISVINWFSI